LRKKLAIPVFIIADTQAVRSLSFASSDHIRALMWPALGHGQRAFMNKTARRLRGALGPRQIARRWMMDAAHHTNVRGVMPAPHRHRLGPGATGNTIIKAQASRGNPSRAAHDANGHASHHHRPQTINTTAIISNTANTSRNTTPNHHQPPANPFRNERTNATTDETNDVNINTPRERRDNGEATIRHEPPEAADRAEWHPQQSPVRGATRAKHAAFFQRR
jgi:hypothetical protein